MKGGLRAQRRQQRLALIADLGGDRADLHKAARIAIAGGMYSPKTNPADIVAILSRTWRFRHRR
jgi:hypothetical protein